jgi:hypothetical protein
MTFTDRFYEKKPITCILVAVLLTSLTGCERVESWFKPRPPQVSFAPYSEDYRSKMDFAQLEYKFPLSPAELARITPENLAALDQEQIDQIYARLTAGPIPDGPFEGKILLARGSSGKFRIAEIAGGLTGLALHLKGLELETVGEALWQGKVFFRSERVLRNRVNDLAALQKAGLIEGEPPKTNINGKDAWLLFPAKVYCGQSLLDARRESIIIDYFFSDEVAGYRERPDFLAGRRGLRVRDEIRMVRPGFYLGRAYMDKVFLLDFTLYNQDSVNRAAELPPGGQSEDCWPGTQQRTAAVAK